MLSMLVISSFIYMIVQLQDVVKQQPLSLASANILKMAMLTVFVHNVLNIFIPPKPFDSWVLDGVNWVAPTPRPLDDKTYVWSEETLAWVEINLVLP
jgi:hypothetical protein